MAKYKRKKQKKQVIPVQQINKKRKSAEKHDELIQVKKRFSLSVDQWRMIGIIPLIFIVAIVPLIIYSKVIVLTPIEKINWLGSSFHIDFFNWYKGTTFLILVSLSFIITITLIVLKKIPFRKTKLFYFIGAYTFFVILSTIFSSDKTIALRGFADMHQGMFILIGYMLLIFCLYQLIDNNKHIIMILSGFVFVGIVIGLLGFYQYIDKDPLKSDFMLKLMLSRDLENLADDIRVIFGQFQVYATLGNTNYVGSFAALMIPLSFALYFYSKNLIYKLFFFLFASLMIFVGFGSNSRAGILGILIGLIFVIILFRKEFLKNPITSLLPFLTLGLIGFVLNIVTDGMISNELKSMDLISEIKNIKIEYEDKLMFEQIQTNDFRLTIKTNKDGIIIEKVFDYVTIYSLEEETLPLLTNGLITSINLDGYEKYQIIMDQSKSFFVLRAHGRSFTVYHTIEGLKLLGMGGELVDAEYIDRLEFLDGYENLFSNRVYIWSLSFPLLKDTIFIGHGPDMYPIAFNQNDFVGKSNYFLQNIIIDKPHNMYIQIGVNTGILSLISILIVFLTYLYTSIKTFISGNFETYEQYLGAGVFLSILAYLITGLFNDQVISITPLFYTLLGVGLIINHLMKSKLTTD